MSDTFGARVRKHREQQGISLDAIANRTKIKASLLEGLERDDISRWPAGIFRRAYARAYAEAIGLDADATVREFLALYPDPVEVLPPPPPPQPTRFRSLLDSALGSLSRRRPADEPEPQEAPRAPAPASAHPPVEASPAPAAAFLAASPPDRAPSPAPTPAARIPEAQPDLLAGATLCTALGRVKSSSELVPLLRDAAKLLGARGLIVWTWDAAAGQLRPSIVHGYADKVRARLRPVKPDADNATAEAFRLAETRAVASRETGRSALAVPLLSAAGCAGVLAIELPQSRAEVASVQAIATFIAAVLAQLIAGPEGGERTADGGTRSPERVERNVKSAESTYSESA